MPRLSSRTDLAIKLNRCLFSLGFRFFWIMKFRRNRIAALRDHGRLQVA